MLELSRDSAVQLAALIAAIGIWWDTIELLSSRRAVLDTFFDWEVVRSRYYIADRWRPVGWTFDRLAGRRTFIVLILLHALAALAFVLLVPTHPGLAALAGVVLLVGHLAAHVRLLVGMDGADQMQTIVWSGLTIYAAVPGEIAKTAAIAFVILQLFLSYWVAGIAKLVSETWRSGDAVGRILRTRSYGTPGIAALSAKRPVSVSVSWATVVFEVFAPFLVLAGGPGLIAFTLAGASFHLGIAFVMRLVTFVWAFGAAYPLVWYAASAWGFA